MVRRRSDMRYLSMAVDPHWLFNLDQFQLLQMTLHGIG